jgi:hypothetical protein
MNVLVLCAPAIFALAGAAEAFAGGWTVATAQNDRTYAGVAMGEGQVAVVPPGVNSSCLGGRVILSTDIARPSTSNVTTTTDIISYRDIGSDTVFSGKLTSPIGAAGFNYGSNDQSLVVLPKTGTVVYQIPGFIKSPDLNGSTTAPGAPANQWWFSYTFRGAWGPGARSAIVSYVSNDCGEHFHFGGIVDSYFAPFDPCANPQPLAETDSNGKTLKDSNGNVVYSSNVPFDMGGGDGPLASVDVMRNRIYLTTSCVGQLPGPNDVKGHPTLSGTGIGHDDVFASDDAGNGFKRVGSLPDVNTTWRSEVTTLGDGTPIVGPFYPEAGIWVGTAKGDGTYSFSVHTIQGVGWGWPKALTALAADNKTPLNVVYVNQAAATHVVRSPQSDKSVLVFIPETVPASDAGNCDPSVPAADVRGCGSVNGFRVWTWDSSSDTFQEMDPILPMMSNGVTPSATGAVVHLSVASATAPDGSGPQVVMAHWCDLDELTGKAIMRARIYLPDGTKSDIVLSQNNGQPRSFALTTAPFVGNAAPFFGDFKAGGGYAQSGEVREYLGGSGKFTYTKLVGYKTVANFVPLWTEKNADGKMEAHTTDVVASLFTPVRTTAIPSRLPPPQVHSPDPLFDLNKIGHPDPALFATDPARYVVTPATAVSNFGRALPASHLPARLPAQHELPSNITTEKYVHGVARTGAIPESHVR